MSSFGDRFDGPSGTNDGTFLINVTIAGIDFARGMDVTKDILHEGQFLRLVREPDNRYDEYAIAFMTGGKRIGYVPRTDNCVLAHLMDAGKYLSATVDSIERCVIRVNIALEEDEDDIRMIEDELIESAFNLRQDMIRGSLVCGAYGDALGAPIEFMSEDELRSAYMGAEDIQPVLAYGVLRFTDDTQMSLLAANAMISREVCHSMKGIADEPYHYAYRYYRQWALKMNETPITNGRYHSWLLEIPEIFAWRAPGNTCMGQLLNYEEPGTLEERPNASKGCGGVMRAAPYGLGAIPKYAAKLGCKDAVTTHGHDLGWLTAGALSGIISRIVYNDEELEDAIGYVIGQMDFEYGKYEGWKDLKVLLERVLDEYQDYQEGAEFDITRFGEGWVAEETLAMALYTSLCFLDDIPSALRHAVFHGGDSDSVGSVTGNILGAIHGYRKVCEVLDVSNLERLDVILRIADDLEDADYESQEIQDVYLRGEVPGDIRECTKEIG